MTTPTFTRPACPVTGCEEPGGWLMRDRCDFHEILSLARELTPERLAEVTAALGGVVPFTDDEKAERRIRSRLRYVTHQTEALARALDMAREDGATEEQLNSAGSGSIVPADG